MELSTLKFDVNKLVDEKKKRVDGGSRGPYVYSVAQRKDMEGTVKVVRDRIKVLDKCKKDKEEDMRLRRQIHNEMKKKLDKRIEQRGKKGTVRKQTETALRKNGIDRPTYHGGELAGVKVKVLLQKIDVILLEFKRIIS
jgi:hypothetical protein